MDISTEKPPPKPPHSNSLQHSELISPITNLANNFRSLSSSLDSTVKEETSLTPTRRMKLSFNSSDENLPLDDAAIDLNPAKSYSKSEQNEILNKIHSEDTKRFKQTGTTRRSLFTEKESKFNRLRRMNSCGNQLPRLDEKFIGRSKLSCQSRSKTVDETRKPLTIFESKHTNTPVHNNHKNYKNSSKSELETDRLFEIAIRSRSCSRHRSDSITPLRKHSSAKSNALEPDDISPPCSPLRLNTTRSNQNEEMDFFERFSDDGFMEEDDACNLSDLENELMDGHNPLIPMVQNAQYLQNGNAFSTNLNFQNLQTSNFQQNTQSTSTPTRCKPQSTKSIEISPLVAPLLARHRLNRTPKKFSTPNSMNKLLNGKINKKSTRRGLFQDSSKSFQNSKYQETIDNPQKNRQQSAVTPKSILKINSPSRARSKTPNKRKFTQISDSPVKRFASPDTPSKIRCRRRKLSYSRAKSVTYNVTAFNPNMMNSPSLTTSSSIGFKNYRCSTNPDEQEKVKLSLDRISSCENVYSGNHTVKKLDLETCPGNGKHPQLTYITGSTLANLMAKTANLLANIDNSATQNTEDVINQHSKFQILDCRYPYEYKGGHIKSALNIPTVDELFTRYFDPDTSSHGYPPNDTVLIFHCEFSSERAPKMMKKLREIDRKRHKYPDLKFPELYLLKDGYQEFYSKFSEFCDGSYVPMLDASYKQEFDNFRKLREKSKTWSDNENLTKIGTKRGKRRLF